MGDCATILVIDDDPSIRLITRRALESFGYLALVAEDGASGVQVFRQQSSAVSAVLLDLSMPGMTGEETLRVLRAWASTPVIVMSGFDETASEGYLSEGLIAGFLQKPFTLDQLRSALDAAMSLGQLTGGVR